ncbi:meprin A subunit beta [Caerostris extrusa]|uniref:Metalloendopeptidase n=1 Tax=Caerostris extrusa TaxID=172846 RepID=A0AAV4UG71_CAEEX|nr:meprin A subunit beta [Caerostris extrusa]
MGEICKTGLTYQGVRGRITVALAAMEFARNTCVRLVPRSNETDYVSLFRGNGVGEKTPDYQNGGQLLFSSVIRPFFYLKLNFKVLFHGGSHGGEQKLSLANACDQVGIVIHEFMHALGFWHEQSRIDRDKYVTIRWDNILPGTENNFQKYTSYVQQTLDEEYDYASLLHYSRRAFSRNSLPTVEPKNLVGNFIIGQRFGFSQTDIRKINKLYNCTDYM